MNPVIYRQAPLVNRIMFSLALYFTLVYTWLIIHVMFRRDNTVNRLTMIPYLLILISGALQVIWYALAANWPSLDNSLAFNNSLCSILRYVWCAIVLNQFLMWDLISELVKFQATHRLEVLDVKKQEHRSKEINLLRIYMYILLCSLTFTLLRLIIPICILKFTSTLD